MDYVKRVRAARGALNLSLDTFADKIGMGRSTLVRIENGSREPKPEEYEAMAEVTGLPIEFFTTPNLHTALAGEAPTPDAIKSLRAEMRSEFSEIRDAIALLSSADLRLQRELEELRGADRSKGPKEGPGPG